MDKSTKDNKFQVLSYHQTLSMLSLIISIWLVGKPLWGFATQDGKERSRAKAESLAYQIAQLNNSKEGLQISENRPLRSPSSDPDSQLLVGQIGQDNAGKAFKYEVFDQDRFVKVVIWSESDDSIKTSVRIPKVGP